MLWNFKRHVLARCPANLFRRDALYNSVPLTMWASQHIEQCAIRNSILTEGVKSFVTPQRERFMCAVKPFEVNCILLSFCACNILCSSLYRDRGGCSLSLSFSRSLAHILIQLRASLCTVSPCEHIFPFVFERSVRVSRFRSLHLNASVPGQWRIISEVLRCVGWLVAVEGCDRDSTEAVISVPVRAAAQRGRLEGFKDF